MGILHFNLILYLIMKRSEPKMFIITIFIYNIPCILYYPFVAVKVNFNILKQKIKIKNYNKYLDKDINAGIIILCIFSFLFLAINITKFKVSTMDPGIIPKIVDFLVKNSS